MIHRSPGQGVGQRLAISHLTHGAGPIAISGGIGPAGRFPLRGWQLGPLAGFLALARGFIQCTRKRAAVGRFWAFVIDIATN